MSWKIFLVMSCLGLAACDTGSPPSSTSSSPLPTTTGTTAAVGPTSVDGPSPSPMASASSSPTSTATPSASASPAASPQATASTPGSRDVDISRLMPGMLASISPLPTASATPGNSPTASATASPALTRNSSPLPRSSSGVALLPNRITAESIGLARVGITYGDLKKSLQGSTFETVPQFASNYAAIAVKQRGQVQFYIPYPQNNPLADGDPVRYLVTDNPSYKTDRGVSSGMTIQQAARIYGPAKLSLTRAVGSSEMIQFTSQPGEIIFNAARSRGLAGKYPESNEEIVATEKYDTKAKIGRITVVCRAEICGIEH